MTRETQTLEPQNQAMNVEGFGLPKIIKGLTQGYPRVQDYEWVYDGWLLSVKELHARRAPGSSCLSALISRKQGTISLTAAKAAVE